MQKLKTLYLGAGFALLAMTGAGQAADLSRPPPPAAPVYVPPPFSWTGFYVGGNLGGAWGHGNITDSSGVSFSGNSNNGVFIGGGQAGFNYQISNFVIGVEGTFDWAANNNNSTNGVVVLTGPLAGDTIQVSGNNRWMTTVAARLGVAWDHWLFYGKGGGGWVGVNNFAVTDITRGVTVTGGNSNNNSGWLAGVGFEWAFTNNWTLKVEYDYFGLSGRTITVPASAFAAGIPATADTFTTGNNNIQTVVVGINYLFNWGGAPVTARY